VVKGILSIDGGRATIPVRKVLRCRTMDAVNGARDHLRYLGPSHAGMSKPSVIENEVGLGDIWARWDEYHGYAD
jgi:hypothetical protein